MTYTKEELAAAVDGWKEAIPEHRSSMAAQMYQPDTVADIIKPALAKAAPVIAQRARRVGWIDEKRMLEAAEERCRSFGINIDLGDLEEIVSAAAQALREEG